MLRGILWLLFSISWSAFGADNAFMSPIASKSLLLDVVYGEKSVAAGERGHILYQQGKAFTQAHVPTTTTLTAIDWVETTNDYWAVGHDATILHSKGNAKNWQIVQSDPVLDRPLLDITFVTPALGFAVGGYGLFYTTSDGGNNWDNQWLTTLLTEDDLNYLESLKDDPEFYEEEVTYLLPHFNRLNAEQDRLLLAGGFGLLAQSFDQGVTWKRLDIDYEGSFYDFRLLSSDIMMAIGLRGNLFIKPDIGEADWKAIPTCVTAALNAIITADEKLFIVGNNGVVLNIDLSKIQGNELQPPNAEGCQVHSSITNINSGISASINNAIINETELLLVSTTGIHTINIDGNL